MDVPIGPPPTGLLTVMISGPWTGMRMGGGAGVGSVPVAGAGMGTATERPLARSATNRLPA